MYEPIGCPTCGRHFKRAFPRLRCDCGTMVVPADPPSNVTYPPIERSESELSKHRAIPKRVPRVGGNSRKPRKLVHGIQLRRRICLACEHQSGGFCKIITARGLGGEIEHPLGLPNADSWCPDLVPRFGPVIDPIELLHKPNQQFVTMERLAHDIRSLKEILFSAVPNLKGIIGCPRSGMMVASQLAAMSGLPLYEVTDNGIVQLGCGKRLKGLLEDKEEIDGPLALIEDSCGEGKSIAEARAKCKRNDIVTAAVYTAPSGSWSLDLYAVSLDFPHFFEWNIFGSPMLESYRFGLDFDGLICRDARAEEDDDGHAYIKFLKTAAPLRLPRPFIIPAIITARLEKYRDLTVRWLARHQIAYKELVMGPWQNKAEREASSVADWKAEEIEKRNLWYYIESDQAMSETIANKTQCTVICPDAGRSFVRSGDQPVIQERNGVKYVRVLPSSTDPKPSPNAENLVIAVVGGQECEAEFALTGPLMRDYAKRIGADFVSLHGDQLPEFPLANKFRIFPYLKAYKRTLYLDCDVVVKPDAPSIFDAVPVGRFAGWNEWPHIPNSTDKELIQIESDEFCDSQRQPNIERTTVINGGVMLFDTRQAECYRPPSMPMPTRWCADQHAITTWLTRTGHEPFWLGDEWHHSYIADWFWDRERFEQAHFIHLHGSRPHSHRMELLQRTVAGNYSQIEPDMTADWLPRWAETQVTVDALTLPPLGPPDTLKRI